ncbi:anaerobic regulatory protein [Robertmurraya siralis]|uniref:Anaerobic regulatory protein n=1 Tax=Robertmurraya siralis TaxID=77777 RepID=A0A920BS87_9BACI|nr:Crp/Fnr family transcriptional regulator [Robertmurraya siralis]PAE21827.1 transcriptional regulator [Bacillus sp. 7504-2]GIN60454.1 anaerobic regulatory protein [Robertmurraya siralis]
MKESTVSLYSLLIQEFIDKETIQKYKAGTILFNERDSVDYIFILLRGSVALGRVHMKGKEFILKILSGEELIIEYQLFKPQAKYHFYAKTFTDCEMLMIKRADFEEFVHSNQNLLNALSSWLSTRYLKAQMKCQDLMMNGKKGGLYSILIRLCNSYGVMTDEGILIDLPLTHQELANFTYGTREVIQRMLKELREKDIISYNQQKLIIKNINYLKESVDCQNCPFEICGIN